MGSPKKRSAIANIQKRFRGTRPCKTDIIVRTLQTCLRRNRSVLRKATLPRNSRATDKGDWA